MGKGEEAENVKSKGSTLFNKDVVDSMYGHVDLYENLLGKNKVLFTELDQGNTFRCLQDDRWAVDGRCNLENYVHVHK